MKSTTAKTKKPRKKGRPPRPESVYYVMEITSWNFDYLFSANPTPQRDGPYYDYRHTHLFGDLLLPLKAKVETLQATLMPDANMNVDAREPVERRSVGFFELRRGRCEVLITIPHDALPLILQMLIAGRYRYLIMYGSRPHRGKAMLYSIHFTGEFDAEEFPEW